MDGDGSSGIDWAILTCASWDFIWPVALRKAAGSKRLLGGDQGDRAFFVMTAFVGRG